MKKTVFFIISTVLFALVCFSCGLETFSEIKPPYNAVPQNAADGITLSEPVDSPHNRKFEFIAKKNEGFIAPGTEVYYRIYNSLERLQSDAKSINSVNADDSTAGFYRMQSLNYRRLRILKDSVRQDLLITVAADEKVVIRLIGEGFGSGVFYAGALFPVFRENNSPFYFGTPNDTQKNPEAGNPDFVYTNPGDGHFYVNAYAVSTGLESSSWTRAVSKVLPLGFCIFKK